MFLRRNLRNFENNVKFSFLGVKKDIDNLHKKIDTNTKGVNESRADFEVLRKELDIFKEDTNESLDKVDKEIINFREDVAEKLDVLGSEVSEIKRVIESKAETSKELKSELKSEIKTLTKSLIDLEDKVKVLKPQEEISVEKIFKEETKNNNTKLIFTIVAIVVVLALVVYGIYLLI